MKHTNIPYTYGIPTKQIQMYNFRDKEYAVRVYGNYMLSRLQQLFKWEGLPDTIPQRNLEQLLLTSGYCVIIKTDEKAKNTTTKTTSTSEASTSSDSEYQYAVIGGLGGEPNVYYEQSTFILANPALPHTKQEWTLNKDCVLIRNDSNMIGVTPLLSRYCSLLVENDISFRLANINTRLSILISAMDDRTAKSAKKYLIDLENGEQGIIASNQFFEGLQTENATRGYSGTLKDLIEYHQYIRASMYNELGLDANYNMKRTFVNSAEVEANEDALFPLVNDMLEQRKKACEIWNELYDMNISVDFCSVWKDNDLQQKLNLEKVKADIENIKADTESKLSEEPEEPEEKTSQNNDSTQLENKTSEIPEENEQLDNSDNNTDFIDDNTDSNNEETVSDSNNNENENESDNNIPDDTNDTNNPDININIEITNIEGDENVLDKSESETSTNESESEEIMEESND